MTNKQTRAEIDRMLDDITFNAIRNNLLIEAGWIAMRALAIPKDAGDHQIEEMKTAFFAGAQHLWASINRSAGTPAELETRMDAIDAELQAFVAALKARIAALKDKKRSRKQ